MLKLTYTGLWLFFLSSKAPKHRKVANVREVRDNTFVQRRRAGERVADTRHLKSSPRDLGKTRIPYSSAWPAQHLTTVLHQHTKPSLLSQTQPVLLRLWDQRPQKMPIRLPGSL